MYVSNNYSSAAFGVVLYLQGMRMSQVQTATQHLEMYINTQLSIR